jgi:hypothetical protein
MFFAIDSTCCMYLYIYIFIYIYIYIYVSKYIFFIYYIKNAPETLPLPEIFENLRFPLPLPSPRSQQPCFQFTYFLYKALIEVLLNLDGLIFLIQERKEEVIIILYVLILVKGTDIIILKWDNLHMNMGNSLTMNCPHHKLGY